MRIAHVTATFPPYYGGTGNVCYHNARVLAERGHEVHVYTSAWPGEADDPPGVAVHRLQPSVRLGNAPLLPRLARLQSFDIVHLHYPFISGAELVGLGAIIRRTPLVLTYHNDLVAPGLRGRLFSLYERSLARISLRAAHRVCAVSRNHAESSRPLTGALRNRPWVLTELPNGVDTELFHPDVDGDPVRRAFGISASARVVAFAGGLDTAHHFKRVDLLIKAIAAIDAPDVHLLIVGDGNLRPVYEQITRDLGIAGRVHFAGSVNHGKLVPYLTASDLLVLPSDSVESFGLALIEAMACQLPVVASDLPGVRTIVSDGIDGLLVAPGNVDDLTQKIRTLLDNPEQRQSMGLQGRATVVCRFSWATIGDRLEEIYQEVLVNAHPQRDEKKRHVLS